MPKIARLILLFSALYFQSQAQAPNYQLYQSTRSTGTIQELDLGTGSILATNVGSLTGARGMAFSPLGGLYIALGNGITTMANSSASPVAVLNLAPENPHDVTFDATGNMYVVTETNVRVFTPGLVPTLTFAHNLTTTIGDGNLNKGWSIAVRPDNGEIFVAGRQGLRHYSPVTGIQIGATIASSFHGMIGIAFTSSSFNNAFLYVGNVISGVDQIRVYDTNLNFLRSFYAANIGNPIDLEVHPGTNDLYLFNTVTSLPVNRFTANETVVSSFNSSANPSRGSALGVFDAILAELDFALELQELGGQALLQWQALQNVNVDHYLIERTQGSQPPIELGIVNAVKETMSFRTPLPETSLSRYIVSAIGQNGEQVAKASATWSATPTEFNFAHNRKEQLLKVKNYGQHTAQIQIRMTNMRGTVVRELSFNESEANISYQGLPGGIYVLQAIGFSNTGAIVGVLHKRLRL